MRLLGVEIDDDEQAYVRRKLGIKLGKFATSIERISVRVTDMNGPRGGVDQVCNIKVVLAGCQAWWLSGGTRRCTPPSTTRYGRPSRRFGKVSSQAHEAASHGAFR